MVRLYTVASYRSDVQMDVAIPPLPQNAAGSPAYSLDYTVLLPRLPPIPAHLSLLPNSGKAPTLLAVILAVGPVVVLIIVITINI